MGFDKYKWAIISKDTFCYFADELQAFGVDGTIPAHADQNMQYAMELMKQRLEKKDISCKYLIRPRGYKTASGFTRSWRDDRYSTESDLRDCEVIRIVERDGKKIFYEKKRRQLRQYIKNLVYGNKAEKDLYTCPSCGAISTIGELRETGCPYCGSHFQTTDLFPKVSGYSIEETAFSSSGELKKSVFSLIIFLVLLFGFGMYAITCFSSAWADAMLSYRILYSAMVGLVVGVPLGYIVWATGKLLEVFGVTGKRIVVNSNKSGAKKKFEGEMMKYTPEFSYEFFSNKVISMLRTVLFANDEEQLLYYIGEPLNGAFDDVVSSECPGEVGIDKFNITDGHCNICARLYMDDILYNGRKARAKRRLYRVYLYKNLNVPVDMYFSVKTIRCKSCGASFDATRARSCPSCGSRYAIGNDDWVVLKVEVV